MSESLLPLVGAGVALLGALLFLISAVGLIRLPDFYTRAHAPAKAATLGLLFTAAGSILSHGLGDAGHWLEKVVLMLFVLITVPISSQVLVRGAAARGVRQAARSQGAPHAEPPTAGPSGA